MEEAIRSIIGQTVTDWELIICDDGSFDNTFAVVQELARREPRIVLIQNERNMGLAPTLNNCLHIARGTYTARMAMDVLLTGEVPEFHVMDGGIITVNTETAALLGLDGSIFGTMANTVVEVTTGA